MSWSNNNLVQDIKGRPDSKLYTKNSNKREENWYSDIVSWKRIIDIVHVRLKKIIKHQFEKPESWQFISIFWKMASDRIFWSY